jgi:hypothetical protein
MILHGFGAGPSVVTDTDCCPSAAPTVPTPDLRDHKLICWLALSSCRSWRLVDLRLFLTSSDHWRPLGSSRPGIDRGRAGQADQGLNHLHAMQFRPGDVAILSGERSAQRSSGSYRDCPLDTAQSFCGAGRHHRGARWLGRVHDQRRWSSVNWNSGGGYRRAGRCLGGGVPLPAAPLPKSATWPAWGPSGVVDDDATMTGGAATHAPRSGSSGCSG